MPKDKFFMKLLTCAAKIKITVNIAVTNLILAPFNQCLVASFLRGYILEVNLNLFGRKASKTNGLDLNFKWPYLDQY